MCLMLMITQGKQNTYVPEALLTIAGQKANLEQTLFDASVQMLKQQWCCVLIVLA